MLQFKPKTSPQRLRVKRETRTQCHVINVVRLKTDHYVTDKCLLQMTSFIATGEDKPCSCQRDCILLHKTAYKRITENVKVHEACNFSKMQFARC